MTIDVKGTRSDPQAEPAAEKFDFFNAKQRLTTLPVQLGAVIVLLAIYIWRFFDPTIGQAESGSLREKSKPDEGPDELKMREGRDEREHSAQDEALKSSRSDAFADDGGQSTDWSPSILLAEAAPTIQFTRFSFEVLGLDAFPPAYGIGSSNDNRRPDAPGTILDFPSVSRPPAATIPTNHGGMDREDPIDADIDTDPDTQTDPDTETNPGAGSNPDTNPGPGTDPETDTDTDTSPEPTSPNRAPKTTGPVRLNDVFAGQAVLFGLTHLLWGATDPDGDQLSIGTMSADVLSIAAIGSEWRVATEPGMLGPVTLTYSITDGEATVWQTAHFEIVRKNQVLTPGDDLFVGSPYDDDIDGLAGDDIIDAMTGNDLVVGGEGNDHIMGGEDNDVLRGEAGDDILFGGKGDDILYGGSGADRLFGDQGDDTVYGEDGDDYLEGGVGNDILDGGAGHDTLDGGAGNDTLVGGTGNDSLYGNEGNDVLDAGEGNDHLVGGIGNDILMDGAGTDIVEAGDGDDIVIGGAGDDTYYGGRGADRLFANHGDDTIYGEDGDDHLEGGVGNDIVDGGAGNDILVGGTGNDNLDGNEGEDVLDAGEGNDHLIGGSGNDILMDGEGEDIVEAGDGDDIVIGGAGDDTYSGGEGFDVLDYSDSAEDLLIHTGAGHASGNSIGDDQFNGFEDIRGGVGDDLFVITGSAYVLSGGRGRDTFVFEVTDDRPVFSDDLVHDILDFVVGDRVRVRDYDISREARTAERDMFRSVYGDDDDDWLRSEFPLLVTHGQIDGIDVTVVTADINGDAVTDLTLNILGLHLGYAGDTLSA